MKVQLAALMCAFACGCAQFQMIKLQSKNEAEWRSALVEVQKDDVGTEWRPMSAAEKLRRIAIGKSIETYGNPEATYEKALQLEAVKALGVMLDSKAIFNSKDSGGRGDKGNGVTGWYNEYAVCDLACSALISVYEETKDPEIKQAVVAVFDCPKGYAKLLSKCSYEYAPEIGELSAWDEDDSKKILNACSGDQNQPIFDSLCDKGNLNEEQIKEVSDAFLKIKNPSVACAKKALLVCKMDKDLRWAENKYQGSKVQREAVKFVPEAELRGMLDGLREQDPNTYWFVWGHCATPAEAAKVFNSKADDHKKAMAVGRLNDSTKLGEIALGENDELTIAAVSVMCDFKTLSAVAANAKRDKKVRDAAFQRIYSNEVIQKNKGVDADAVIVALMSFDGAEGFGKKYRSVYDALTAAKGLDAAVAKIKGAIGVRVNQIIADGETVKHVTFCHKGIRLGMYKWEFELITRYFGIKDITYRDGLAYALRADTDYITNLAFYGDSLKSFLELPSDKKRALVKDQFTEIYGDGGELWNCDFTEQDEYGVMVLITPHDKLPPRFIGRKATSSEKEALRKEAEYAEGLKELKKNTEKMMEEARKSSQPATTINVSGTGNITVDTKTSKCSYCGAEGYGTCFNSPSKFHEHRSDMMHCIYCGAEGYGTCFNSPTKFHRHGNGSGKCIWCGAEGYGSCFNSPSKMHEQ